MKAIKIIGIIAASVFILFLIFIAVFDWNWFKGYLNDRLSDINGRAMVIEGDIDVDLGWTLGISLEEIRFENADWSDRPEMARIGRAEIDVKLIPLLKGDIRISRLYLDEPRLLLETSPEGRNNWNLSPESDPDAPEKTGETKLPTIESLVVRNGRIAYRNPSAGTDLEGTITTGDGDGNRTIINADGKLLNEPLRFRFTGDSLTDLQERGIAYQARMTAGMGESRGEAEGVIYQPLRFQRMDLNLTLQGPDFSTPAALWDEDFPETPPYRLNGRLILEDGVWRLKNFSAELGESRFGGSLIVDPTGDRPRIEADLDAEILDIAQWMAEFESESPGEKTLDASLLTDRDADIRLEADRVVLPKATLDRAAFHLRLEDGRLRIDSLELKTAEGTVKGSVSAEPADSGIRGSANLELENVDPSRLGIGGEGLGTVSGRVGLELPPVRNRDRIPAELNIEAEALRYHDPASDTDITADLRTESSGDERRLTADLSGRYLGRSVDLSVTGGPLPGLLDPETPYSVSADGSVNERPIRIDADLSRRENGWNLENLDAALAESDLRGDIRMETSGQRPRITADFTSETLDVERLTEWVQALAAIELPSEAVPDGPAEADSDPDSNADTDTPEKIDPTGLGMLSRFDADIGIQADRIMAPDLPMKDVRIDLALENGNLTVSPLAFTLRGGSVTADITVDAKSEPLSGTVEARFQQIDPAEILDPFTDIDTEAWGVLNGNLDFTITRADPAARDRNILMPNIGLLEIGESRITYVNPPEDTRLTLSIQTLAGPEHERPARITGDGRYRGEPFELSFRGAPLLDLREPNDPYSFDLEIKAADTEASISGRVRRVFDLQGFDLTLDIEGPNPARLYPLTGIPFPDLPPYVVGGGLSFSGATWKFEDFKGRVGNSDLRGDIRVDTGGDRPNLIADIESRHLDVADLAGLLGGEPEASDAPEQQGDAAGEGRDRFVIPDKPFSLERMTAIDAAVDYRADRVISRNLPLDEVIIVFDLNAGRMTFEPLEFGLEEGSIRIGMELEAGEDGVKGVADAEIRRFDLNQVLRRFEIADESIGIVGGRAKYWLEGGSVAELLASADGGSYLLMTGGRLDSMLVEVAGLDLGEALVLLFGESDSVPIDCAYADLHSANGVMTIETFVVDTVDTLFTAAGKIDFNRERWDLIIEPHPKDFSFFSAPTPLNVTGTFKNPEVSPDRSDLAARGAASLGLGLIAGPAALLPLIQTGTGNETGVCRGMMEFLKEGR